MYDPYSYDPYQGQNDPYGEQYAEQMRQSYLSQLDQGPAPEAPSPEPAPAPPSEPLAPSAPPPSPVQAQVEPQQAQLPAAPDPYQTREGVGVSQAEYNVGIEPGREYQDMPGFLTERINDPTETDPKYVMARIIQNMGLNASDPRSYDILTREMQQRFPGMQRTGADVWDFSNVAGIGKFGAPIPQDFVVNQGGPGASWGFMNTGEGGGGVKPGGFEPPKRGGPQTFDLGGFSFDPRRGYQFGLGGQLPPELASFYNAQTQAIQAQQAQQQQIQASMRDALLRLMAQGQEPVDVANDQTLGPAAAAYRNAQRREQRQGRAALAERAAFTGLNLGGQGSGSFEAALQGQEEGVRNAIAGYEAQLAQTELQNRRGLLINALQIAQALGARTEANDLQRELAQLDAQLRQASMAQQQSQFSDSMSLNYNQLLAQLNRDATLAAMSGD